MQRAAGLAPWMSRARLLNLVLHIDTGRSALGGPLRSLASVADPVVARMPRTGSACAPQRPRVPVRELPLALGG